MGFLHEGEKIILKDDAKSNFFGKGILVMTGDRIVFAVTTGGILSKKEYEVKINQPLSTVKQVSVPARKTLQIQFEGSVEPTALFLDNPEKWEAALKSALTVSGGQ